MGRRYGHVVTSWISTIGSKCANGRGERGEHIFTGCAHRIKFIFCSMSCSQYVTTLNGVCGIPMGCSVITDYYYAFVVLTILCLSFDGSQTFSKKVFACTL